MLGYVGFFGALGIHGTDHFDAYTQVLAEQQAGLAHLTKILQKDLKDLGVIMGVPAGVEGEGYNGYASGMR